MSLMLCIILIYNVTDVSYTCTCFITDVCTSTCPAQKRIKRRSYLTLHTHARAHAHAHAHTHTHTHTCTHTRAHAHETQQGDTGHRLDRLYESASTAYAARCLAKRIACALAWWHFEAMQSATKQRRLAWAERVWDMRTLDAAFLVWQQACVDAR